MSADTESTLTDYIGTRWTSAERERIEQAATAARRSKSGFIRNVVMEFIAYSDANQTTGRAA